MWARFLVWWTRTCELAGTLFMGLCMLLCIVLLVTFPALLHGDWRCIFVKCALVTP